MTNEKTFFLKKITPYDKDGKPGVLQLVWGDGKMTEIELNQISEQNKTRATWHGLSQRFGDAVAGCSKDNAFEYARKQITELYEVLQSPEWTKGHAGGKGETEQSILDLISAIATLKKKKPNVIEPTVRGVDKTKRDEWRKHPAIITLLGEIALERAREAAKESAEFDFPI